MADRPKISGRAIAAVVALLLVVGGGAYWLISKAPIGPTASNNLISREAPALPPATVHAAPTREAAKQNHDGAQLSHVASHRGHSGGQAGEGGGSAGTGENAAAVVQPCGSVEDAYQAISRVTQGEDIAAIQAALNEVIANPVAADPTAPTLANRLRHALALGAAAPCENVQTALRGAGQLAQLASNSGTAGPITAAIGQPSPLSPSYQTIPTGAIGGARGHGYCVNLGHCDS